MKKCFTILGAFLLSMGVAFAQPSGISLPSTSPYTQDFNTTPGTSGTTYPAGWGPNNNGSFQSSMLVGGASSTTGAAYNYGSKIGILGSGSNYDPGFLILVLNNTSGKKNLKISYNITKIREQGRSNTFDLEISTSSASSGYSKISGGGYTSGTIAQNTVSTYTDIDISAYDNKSGPVYIRWNYTPLGGAGSRDGLALDDVVISWASKPVLDTITTIASRTNTGATLGCTVLDSGISAVLEKGIVWSSTSSSVMLGGNGMNKVLAGSGSNLGSYTVPVTGLPAGTKIYFRAFLRNAADTAYSNVSEFFTLSNSPTANAGNLQFNRQCADTALLTWTAAAGASHYMILKGGAPAIAPVDGNIYTAGMMLGNSEVLGYVANSNSNMFVLRGLTNNTTYTYSIVALGWNGTEPTTANYFTPITYPIITDTNFLRYPAPFVPTDNVCEGSTYTIAVANPAGGTIRWYSDAALTTMLAQGTTFTSPVLTKSDTFYVTNYNKGCQSAANMLILNMLPLPINTMTMADTACFGNMGMLVAKYDVGTVTWFANATGGSSIHEGDTLSVQALKDTTYYVASTQNGCFSERLPVTLTVNPLPEAPVGLTLNQTVCERENVTLVGSPVESNAFLVWRSTVTGQTSTGSTFTIANIAGNDTVVVFSSLNGCAGPIQQLAIEVLPISVGSFVLNTSELCSNPQANFTATPSSTIAGSTYQWLIDGTTTLNTPTLDVNIGTPGAHSIALITRSPDGCLDTTSQTVNVYPLPVATYTYAQVGANYLRIKFTPSTTGAGFTYKWKFNANDSSALVSPEFEFLNKGDYPVSLTITNSNGCSATTTQTLMLRDVSVADGLQSQGSLRSAVLYPNPTATGNATTLQFSLEQAQTLQYSIVNVSGQVVMQSAAARYNAGEQRITLNETLAAGTYLVRLVGVDAVLTLPLIVR